ncbi:class I SAM-dependent methyltransferase [Dactylosporangium sp. NPDC051541]|uniref:class I SAM-dependent methyltransferase n=1 Tax=Dactylosporangium sp. NPDC051541 TaxID=3363977 RepID=UPI00379CD372
MHHLVKRRLAGVGARLGASGVGRLRRIASHLELGHWLRSVGHALPPERGLVNRWPVLDIALAGMGTAKPLYLEFGVFTGQSLRYVAERLPSPRARFIGFDSFQGLPETWRHDIPRGAFSLQGRAPVFEDSRISVVSGWFDETLSSFEPPEFDRLLINVDVDVYSSARSVLLHVERFLHPGTLLYLDEFNDSGNELRAFRELIERTGLRFRIRAASRCLSHWLFEFV